jgi:hypothetical protein
MRLNVFQKLSISLLAGLLASTVQAQVPDIPANVSGTYTLTYAFASGTTPFANGTVKTFVLNGTTDVMCVDGVSLGTGYFRSGAGSEMLWNGGNGTYYALSLLTAGGFSEINVYSPSDAGNNWKGQFPGPGTYSSAVTCGATSGGTTPTLTTSQQAVISVAAGLYPDLFTGGGAVTLANGYVTQSFTSGVTVGFKDGAVFTSGGPFGSTIQNRGTEAAVTTSLTNLKNSINVTPSTDITNLFNLAVQAYPTLLAGGGSFLTSADGYLYKYFSTTGMYAAVKNGTVYLKGGAYGNAYTNVGALNAVLTSLNTKVNGSTGGTGNIPQGNFNLTVSGTVTLSGIVSITQPFSFSVNGIPAPSVSNTDAIRSAFQTSLGGSGATIGSFSFTVVENAATRVEFNVTATATVSGLTSSYALNYVYSK